MRDDTGTSHQAYSLELWGPILPHTVHGLCHLFSQTQDGDFTSSFSVHDPTGVFNVITKDRDYVPDNKLLENCGLSAESLEQFMADNNLGRQAVHEIEYANNKYSFS